MTCFDKTAQNDYYLCLNYLFLLLLESFECVSLNDALLLVPLFLISFASDIINKVVGKILNLIISKKNIGEEINPIENNLNLYAKWLI